MPVNLKDANKFFVNHLIQSSNGTSTVLDNTDIDSVYEIVSCSVTNLSSSVQYSIDIALYNNNSQIIEGYLAKNTTINSNETYYFIKENRPIVLNHDYSIIAICNTDQLSISFNYYLQVESKPITNIWTPENLGASLTLWLDADDADSVTLNGSSVSQWADKSGNGRNVSQPVATNQPAYQATGFAGKAGIYFNGAEWHLFNASPFMYDAGSVSVFSAMRPAPYAINQWFLAEGASDNNLPIYGTLVNRARTDFKDQSFYYRSNSGSGTSGTLLLDDGMVEADRIVGFTDSGTEATAYNNGTTGSSVTYTRSVTILNRFAIGGLLRAALGLGMRSTAGEIVVATGVLSADDRQKLEGYLAHKWGLAANLPNDHPYKNSAP